MESMQPVQLVQIVLGLALLALGRKGLGFFLGAIGFVVGMTLATALLEGTSPGVAIAIGIVGGVVGAFVAFFVQKVAVVAAGLLGGGYVGFILAHDLGMRGEGFPWVPVVVCGILGIVLAFFILKWALIVLSSLVGAYLVVDAVGMQEPLAIVLFAVLAATGIFFQSRSGTMQKKQTTA
jgi:hypothetical protein